MVHLIRRGLQFPVSLTMKSPVAGFTNNKIFALRSNGLKKREEKIRQSLNNLMIKSDKMRMRLNGLYRKQYRGNASLISLTSFKRSNRGTWNGTRDLIRIYL